jgi:hypothetical protein
VNHLHEVASTLLTNPVAARNAVVDLGSNGLEDGLNMRPGIGVATGHDGRTPESTLLTSRNASADEQNSLLGQVVHTAVGIREVGVTTVNNDITLIVSDQKE